MLSWKQDKANRGVVKYNLAMNNFLAECVRFFLDDPTTSTPLDQGQLNYFESAPVNSCEFISGATYYMDVVLEKSDQSMVMCESGFPGPKSYLAQFTAKDPVCRQIEVDLSPYPCNTPFNAFAGNIPPEDTTIYNLWSTFNGRYFGPATQKWISPFNYQSASQGAHYNVSDPAQAPYTPPYYYGKSIARIKYTPADEWTTGNSQVRNPILAFFQRMEVEYLNPELEKKIKLGNMNYVGSTPSSSFVFEDTFTTSSFAYSMAQNVGDSINLKGLKNALVKSFSGIGTLENLTNEYVPDQSRYVISSKFECPILDFKYQSSETMSISGGLHPPMTLSSSGFLDNTPIALGKGMWSGYGIREPNKEYVKMSLVETPASAIPEPPLDFSSVSPSLIEAFKFYENNPSGLSTELGKLSDETAISEAIVAIPFSTEVIHGHPDFAATVVRSDSPKLYDLLNNGRGQGIDNINLFAIDRKLFDCYRSKNPNWINTAAAPQNNSIIDMIKLMQEFVFPPMMDFVQNSGIPPFVSYIFKFSHNLNKLDLQDIWQGVLPRIGVAAEVESKTIKHSLTDRNQFFHGKKLPTSIRWLVFKVKKRAEMDYGKVTQWNTDDVGGMFTPEGGRRKTDTGVEITDYTPSWASKFSYNWPHDFYSLVELGKIKSEVSFLPPIGRGELIIPCDEEKGGEPKDTSEPGVKIKTPDGTEIIIGKDADGTTFETDQSSGGSKGTAKSDKVSFKIKETISATGTDTVSMKALKKPKKPGAKD
jgi:hypothetical protein